MMAEAAVERALAAVGLRLRPEFLANQLRAQPAGRTHDALAALVLQAVLITDLRDCALPCLPPEASAAAVTSDGVKTFPGPWFLQLDELVNVGASAVERDAGDGRRSRLFKLALTDGSSLCTGMERTRVSWLSSSMCMGCKLVVRHVCVRRGVLQLTEGNSLLIGGSVPSLVALQAYVAAGKPVAALGQVAGGAPLSVALNRGLPPPPVATPAAPSSGAAPLQAAPLPYLRVVDVLGRRWGVPAGSTQLQLRAHAECINDAAGVPTATVTDATGACTLPLVGEALENVRAVGSDELLRAWRGCDGFFTLQLDAAGTAASISGITPLSKKAAYGTLRVLRGVLGAPAPAAVR